MRSTVDGITFAPTDLARFMENPYVSWMDRLHLEHPGRVTPDDGSDETKIIADLGTAHERAYVDKLCAAGRDVLEIPGGSVEERAGATEAAMVARRDVIYQGALAHGNFSGFADFLFRVSVPSRLGDYSYEAWDTKLALRAKPYFLIQLCCYADILEQLQGVRPRRVVIVPGRGGEREFRTDDYFYYYLALKKAFLEQQAAFDPGDPPEPLAEGKNGRWESEARRWLEETDHLSRVAGIRADQVKKLRAAGIGTLHALATTPADIPVSRLRTETLARLRQQARLQLESAGRERPLYEVVRPVAEDPYRGLRLLPPRSALDIAFDIEGYPLVEGGLEYLLGATTQDNGALDFRDWWAHDDAQEKASFERFVDWTHERWRRDPTMHVYHYAAYEVTAMRRLMGKYGTRESEVDDLLRNEVFVDLYKVVHQGLRIGVPSYSLKKVESLYLESRQEEVATASDSIVFYQRWMEEPDGDDWQTSEILRKIRDYNEVDCVSTWKLVEWLRGVQEESGVAYLAPPQPDEERKEKEGESSTLAQELLDTIPEDRSDDTDKWRVHELLAWLLEFHSREEKPMWWRMFDRRDMTEYELREDLDCLAGLTRTETPPRPEKKSMAFEFRFDANQDTKIRKGADDKKEKRCYFAHDLTSCSVLSMDAEQGRITLKLGPKALKQLEPGGVPSRLSLIPNEHVSGATMARSIYRIAQRYEQTGELPPALADFLHRRRPNVPLRAAGPLNAAGESPFETALAVVPGMADTTLCVQGPPGTGKSYTGAHVILKLLADGKRVGVAANSHKAICNLLMKVSEEAEDRGQTLDAVKVGGDEDEPLLERPGFSRHGSVSNLDVVPPLVGGTAWVFSHDNLEGELDYLFVDEAGQVSIANLVAMSPSAQNIVLLGDQMQLSEPTEGSHPGESGLSCLEYLLQDHATVPNDLGIFLGVTWRMHPNICRFISGAVYEDRLTAQEHTVRRRIVHPRDGRIDQESGILYVPVEHVANRQGSEEEVAMVRELVDELLRCRHTDRDGQDAGPLRKNHILIVAPYNLQVRMLQATLGTEFRIGTIDKFQGQEAPVVIVSMAASTAEGSPRGLDFLFDRNRLNVAISRAQSLAILVGHPDLAKTPCHTLKQMELVNVFARATSMAPEPTADTLQPSGSSA